MPGQNFIDESHEVLKFLQKRATLDGSRGERGGFYDFGLLTTEGRGCVIGGSVVAW